MSPKMAAAVVRYIDGTFELPNYTGSVSGSFDRADKPILTEKKVVPKVNNKAKRIERKVGFTKPIQQVRTMQIRTRSSI